MAKKRKLSQSSPSPNSQQPQQQQEEDHPSSNMLLSHLSKKSKHLITPSIAPIAPTTITTKTSTLTSTNTSMIRRNRSTTTTTTASPPQIPILFKNRTILIIDKPHDVHLDGKNDVTIEKLVNEQHSDLTRWLEDETNNNHNRPGRSNNHKKMERRKLKFCHQLDYSTSGVLCLAFTKDSCARIATCFQFRTTQKWYLAVVLGHLSAEKLLLSPTLEKKSNEEKLEGIKEGISIVMNKKQKNTTNNDDDDDENCEIHIETMIGNDLNDSRGFRMRNWSVSQASALGEERLRMCEVRSAETVCTILKRGYYLVPVDVVGEQNEQSEEKAKEETENENEKEAESEENEEKSDVKNEEKSTNGDAVLVQIGEQVYKKVPVTKLLLKPRTGRRHQLRLHTKYLGHPICGDATYANDFEAHRMMLHAWRLTLPVDLNDESYTKPTKYKNRGVDENTPMVTFQTEDPFEGELFEWMES